MARKHKSYASTRAPIAPTDDTTTAMSPNLVAVDEKRDGEHEEQLAQLRDEREMILAQTHPDLVSELAVLRTARTARLKVACDARAYRLADARARAELDARVARSEFAAAKAALRAQMLGANGGVRKRVDALRAALPLPASPAAVVRRRRHVTTSRVRPLATTLSSRFVADLERQGVLRLALAPDDVNADLATVLRSVASAVAPQGAPAAEHGAAAQDPYASMNPNEHVHTSRGILHYHDDVFEKGDTVAVYPSKIGSLPKYHGPILAINRKELTIRSGENTGMFWSSSALSC